jgi:hypothetical protein
MESNATNDYGGDGKVKGVATTSLNHCTDERLQQMSPLRARELGSHFPIIFHFIFI